MSRKAESGDFFFVGDRSYDGLAEKALPHYHDIHRMMVQCLPNARDAALEILDLGVGTGVTSAYFLDYFFNARVTGVDLFREMLDDAHARLARFGDRVHLVQADNTTFLAGSDAEVDAVVSAFCLHHQDEDGKRELFRAVRRRLRPGGAFLMADWSTFSNRHLAAVAKAHTLDHLQASVTDAEYRAKWEHHWASLNIPSPADEMIQWLQEAGFSAETVFRDFEIVVLAATAS